MPAPDAPFIFVIAGEPSGDALGAALIRAMRERTGGRLRVAGIGGEQMREEGVESLVPLSELAVAGLAEVLPHAPRLLRRIRETVAAIRAMRPDAVVTIDSSGFCWRVAHRLRRAGERMPLIAYVAPMVWAWRPGRARHMARWYDHVLTLLPFEPPYFEKVGLAAFHVGHPVLESGAGSGDAARFRAMHGIAAGERVLSVLPGSRGGEVRRLMPIFGETLERLDRTRRAVPGRGPDCRDGGRNGRAGRRATGREGRSCCTAQERKNTTPSPPAAPRWPPRARSRSNWRWRACRWRSPIA